MARETYTLRYRGVIALNDLRMARGATEFLSPSQFGEMRGVVERILVFEQHFALEQPGLVATVPQTGGIGYLRMRSSAIIPRYCLEQLDQTVSFGTNKSVHSRRDMAIDAFDRAVGGCSPTVHVRLHEMARFTEFRLVAIVEDKPRHHSEYQDDKSQHD